MGCQCEGKSCRLNYRCRLRQLRPLTLDQLLEAIDIQIREEMEEGKHRLLGTILFEHGLITVLQVDDVLKRMGKEPS